MYSINRVVGNVSVTYSWMGFSSKKMDLYDVDGPV